MLCILIEIAFTSLHPETDKRPIIYIIFFFNLIIAVIRTRKHNSIEINSLEQQQLQKIYA